MSESITLYLLAADPISKAGIAAEGIVHALPFFATRCGDELRRRVLFRPFAGALMERIGPGQDLLVRQSGKALLVTHAPPRRQQARQRRAPRQTSATLL